MTSYATTRKPVRALVAATLCLVLTGAYLQEALGPFLWLSAPEARAVGGHDAVDEIGQTNEFTDGDPNQSVAEYERGDSNSGDAANAFQFAQPKGVAVFTDFADTAVGYVVDASNNRVLGFHMFLSCGDGCAGVSFEDRYAYAVLGQPDFRSTGFGVSADELNGPVGAVIGAAGGTNYLFIADSGNHRVLAYALDEDGLILDGTADYVLGQEDFSAADPATTQDGMNTPYHLAYNGDTEYLFVADSGNHRVLAFDLSGGISDGMDASYVLGQANFTSGSSNQGGSAAADTLSDPRGLAVNPGDDQLYVADRLNNRVLVYDIRLTSGDPQDFCANGNTTDGLADGMDASCVLGQSDFITTTGGFSASEFSEPSALAYTTSGSLFRHLWVGSYTDNRVLAFAFGDVEATLADGMAATDQIGFDNLTDTNQCGSDELVPCASSLNEIDGIYGIQMSDDDNLFITDTTYDRVMEHFVGQGDLGDTGYQDAQQVLGQFDGTTGTSDMLDTVSTVNAWGTLFPSYLTLDQGNQILWASDTGNNRVLGYYLDGVDNPQDRGADRVLGQGKDSEGQFGIITGYYESALGYEGRFRSSTANFAVEDCSGPCEPEGVANDYNMTEPQGVAYGPGAGYFFFLDAGNGRLVRHDDQPDGAELEAEHALAFSGQEAGIAYDADNDRLFVPEGEGADQVTVYDSSFNVVDTVDTDVFSPTDVAYDADNNQLFVTSTNCVVVYDASIPLSGQSPFAVLGDTDASCSGGGGTTETTMSVPRGLAIDPAGARLFVSDSGNNRVLQFDVADIDSGEAAAEVYGQDDFTSGDANTTQSGLSDPRGIIYLANADRIAVADRQNNRIMFFDAVVASGPGPTISPHIATDALGQLNDNDGAKFTKSGVNNGPNRGGFSGPEGLAIDAVNHRLFVAEPGSARVLMFNLDTDNTLDDRFPDAVLGAPDYSSYGQGGTEPTAPPGPIELAYDSVNNRLFLVDWYDAARILVYDTATVTDNEGPVNVIGQPDLETFDICPAADEGSFCELRGIAYDETGERLFTADQGHNRVLVFDLSGGITDGMDASWVIGQPDFSTTDFNLTQDGVGDPAELAFDPTTNRLFLEDPSYNRVTVYDVSTITDGEPAINVLGQDDFVSNGSALDADSLYTSDDWSLTGLAIDPAGQRLFVVDGQNYRVMVFDIDTSVLIPDDSGSDGPDAINVLAQENFTSNEQRTTQDGIVSATGAAFADDLLYVADTGSSRVMVWDVATVLDGEDAVDLLGQLDESGNPLFMKGGENDGPNRRGFNFANGLAVDRAHNRIFAGDPSNNRILVFDLNTNGTPEDRIPDFVLGQTDFTSAASGTTAGTLRGPEKFSYDSVNDLLYVADTGNHRVVVYDTASITNGEDAVFVIGQPNFTSGDANQGGATDDDGFAFPVDTSIEPLNGILAVADPGNHRVMVFDVGLAGANLANGMPASVVIGQSDFTSNSAGLSASELTGPLGVLAETNLDTLWVADSGNNRVLGFSLFPISTGDAAYIALGQPDDGDPFDSNGDATSAGGMSGPDDIALLESDAVDQRVFVTDSGNNRVLVFNSGDGLDSGEEADDVYGQTSFTAGNCGGDDEVALATTLCDPTVADYDEEAQTLWVVDAEFSRVLAFGPPPSGGGSNPAPPTIGFTPLRIEVNDEQVETDSRNVLVKVFATSTDTFTGTVDILLSNDPRFATFIPFRYVIPERRGNQTTRDIWPKTMAWDLCFGLEDPNDCDPGRKIVYARFYVNVPAPTPQLLPTPETAVEHPDPTP